jgi:hypothetical protein
MKKRGRRSDPYTMWLCQHLASGLTGDAILNSQFLPQDKKLKGRHSERVGGFVTVGERLNMTADAVAANVRNAQKRLDTKEGLQEYFDWLNQRERQWWFYQAVRIEKRELPPMHLEEFDGGIRTLTPINSTEIEAIAAEAQMRWEKGAMGKLDYDKWYLAYERRGEKGKADPRVWRMLNPDDPLAIALYQARDAKGLKNQSRKMSAETRARMSAAHKSVSRVTRDKEIQKLRDAGMSPKALAERFKLSNARICQITRPTLSVLSE